jgi:fumarate reductase subunit C
MSPLAYLLQRGTAMVMAPLVLAHLAVIVFAVQGGLSAEEILARTRGSLGWGLFYGLFVLAAALHAGIGLQTVAREWLGLGRRGAGVIAHGFMLVLVLLGARAVYAVVLA